MSNIVIRVENLSKQYKIGGNEGYKTMRDVITDTIGTPLRKIQSSLERKKLSGIKSFSNDYIWALKNISFEVKQGEVVGIIGPNGAGKSTLLKILSRITEPTKGCVEIDGRVASLLEVGTGFHLELTGRENIYLNGAILGMRRAEINKKFDEIVEFAGISKFLDTPVKHYSSGMYMRLAFAVAAHLEPEILLVDEVLAVGDAHFQGKCIGKMNEVSKLGRTVLFVSHNMEAINTLCSKVFLLEKGNLIKIGPAPDIINFYLNEIGNSTIKGIVKAGDEDARIIDCRIINKRYQQVKKISINEEVGIEIEYEILSGLKGIIPNFALSTLTGIIVLHNICTDSPSSKGRYKTICWMPANFLNNIKYKVRVAIVSFSPFTVDHAIQEIFFEATENIDESYRGNYRGEIHGVVRPYLNWEEVK